MFSSERHSPQERPRGCEGIMSTPAPVRPRAAAVLALIQMFDLSQRRLNRRSHALCVCARTSCVCVCVYRISSADVVTWRPATPPGSPRPCGCQELNHPKPKTQRQRRTDATAGVSGRPLIIQIIDSTFFGADDGKVLLSASGCVADFCCQL